MTKQCVPTMQVEGTQLSHQYDSSAVAGSPGKLGTPRPIPMPAPSAKQFTCDVSCNHRFEVQAGEQMQGSRAAAQALVQHMMHTTHRSPRISECPSLSMCCTYWRAVASNAGS